VASPSPRFAGRRALLLVLVGLIGFCLIVSPPAMVVGPPRDPGDASSDDPAEIPIVAIRGEPLAPHEEHLPPGARVRFGSTRFRHPRELGQWQAQIAGAYFVSHDAATFTLTEVETGRRVWTQPVDFQSHQRYPSSISVAASPDGRFIVVSDFGFLPPNRVFAQVWEALADPPRPIRLATALRMPAALDTDFIDAVFCSEGNSEVWVLTTDGIHVFDIESAQHLRHVRTKGRILAMDQSCTRFLTSSDHDPRFILRDGSGWYAPPSPSYRFSPKADTESMQRAKKPLGTLVRSTDAETDPLTLTVADALTGHSIFNVTVHRGRGEAVSHLGLSPDGRYLSCEADYSLTVFDVDRGQQILQLDTCEGDAKEKRLLISDSWFSADSRRFTVTGANIFETQFDLTTGLEVSPRGENPTKRRRFGREPQKEAVTRHGVLRRPDDRRLPPGYAGIVVACSPGGPLIAIGDATGRLEIWHSDGRLLRSLRTGDTGIAAVTFSPDGWRLAACDESRVVRVWKVGSWRECDRIDVPANNDELCPKHLVFSPDSRRLLVSRGDIMALSDLGSRKWVWDVPGHDLSSKAHSPVFMRDGSRVMCPDSDHWIDADNGSPSTPILGGGRIRCGRDSVRWADDSDDSAFAISPSGSEMAFIDKEGRIQISCIFRNSDRPPFLESSAVCKKHGVLRYSPDGRRLVTCDNRGHAHVWEVATGSLAFTLTYPDGDIADVFFGNDGRSLITANHREVIVWGLDPEPGEAGDLWGQLGYPDAAKAEPARRRLLADPGAAVQLFRERLRPATPTDRAIIERQIRALDAEDYRDRERAAAGIRALGRRALPFLREARPQAPEARERVKSLTAELAAGPTTDELRHIRAVEILNLIGSPDARALLTELATGDPDAVLTEEARRK
jgi:WD40 repeat protein